MVQVLPKDFQVSVDHQDTNWVINAAPKGITEQEWRANNNLPPRVRAESSNSVMDEGRVSIEPVESG